MTKVMNIKIYLINMMLGIYFYKSFCANETNESLYSNETESHE